ncbi:unnamed protein product [Adineta ricciae]|uniref:Uncharacterized protein n=1 Tax=Adineta ricciae TaxID=249248 RepID=A0A815WJN0_ADIRI|nr:unnamed protein product [Adineta ricciae]
MTTLQFRESLVRSLLLGTPFENLKPGPRQQPTSHLKRKLADHKLEEKERFTRSVGRRCTGCYAMEFVYILHPNARRANEKRP